jgi:hypothetical protein
MNVLALLDAHTDAHRFRIAGTTQRVRDLGERRTGLQGEGYLAAHARDGRVGERRGLPSISSLFRADAGGAWGRRPRNRSATSPGDAWGRSPALGQPNGGARLAPGVRWQIHDARHRVRGDDFTWIPAGVAIGP